MNKGLIQELEKIQKKIADIPYDKNYELLIEQVEIINKVIIEIEEVIDLEVDKEI